MSIDTIIPLNDILATGETVHIFNTTNGYPDEIEDAIRDGESPEFIEWLRESVTVFRIGDGPRRGVRLRPMPDQPDQLGVHFTYGSASGIRAQLKSLDLIKEEW